MTRDPGPGSHVTRDLGPGSHVTRGLRHVTGSRNGCSGQREGLGIGNIVLMKENTDSLILVKTF